MKKSRTLRIACKLTWLKCKLAPKKCSLTLTPRIIASNKCRKNQFWFLKYLPNCVKKVSKLSENFHFSDKHSIQSISGTQALRICKLCPKTNLFKLLDLNGNKIAPLSVVSKWLCQMVAIHQFSWAKTRMQVTFKKSKSLHWWRRSRELKLGTGHVRYLSTMVMELKFPESMCVTEN